MTHQQLGLGWHRWYHAGIARIRVGFGKQALVVVHAKQHRCSAGGLTIRREEKTGHLFDHCPRLQHVRSDLEGGRLNGAATTGAQGARRGGRYLMEEWIKHIE